MHGNSVILGGKVSAEHPLGGAEWEGLLLGYQLVFNWELIPITSEIYDGKLCSVWE